MADHLFRFKPFAVAEVGGKTREEAIQRAFAFMDAHSFNRKKPAADRYEVFRVARLSKIPGVNWWAVHYRPKRSPP